MQRDPSRTVLELGTRTVELETGVMARQADAAVFVREGDNAVLVTVVAARTPRPGADFFPLTVEYREKMAAGGRIPGGYLKREGRISDREILTCRLIDRSLRPLFPAGFRCEVQVEATVYSAAATGDVESLALIGAGAALHLSPVPFDGPLLGCRSVLHRDRTTLLPVLAEREEATCDLMVSVGPHGLVMVEGEANEIAEDTLLNHLLGTVGKLDKLRAVLEAWREQAGSEKRLHSDPDSDPALAERAAGACSDDLMAAFAITGKHERHDALTKARDAWLADFEAKDEGVAEAHAAFSDLEKRLMRTRVVSQGLRLDGRAAADIRDIAGTTRLLPRAHGSALFTRGETQALVTCTLGSGREGQRIETLFGTEERRFLLHYNFPPFSVGETRPLRGPGRREIGHGNLAWRALAGVVPAFEAFPYAVRIESDILESNGSSSMASVCGGCLALMDAGVPIERAVAGVAMGLIAEGDQVAILSDILGDEDHLGDMDFKVTGTSTGITALQMDNKIGGLTRDVLERAIRQARSGLDHILGKMHEILGAARSELAKHAPHVHTIRVQPHLIRSVIGPRGETIKGIQEASGANVAIDNTGLVTIYAPEGPAANQALAAIKQVAGEVSIGETYTGTISGIAPFGAFVKIYESAEGLVANEKFGGRSPQQGQEWQVRVLGVDKRGRIELEPM
ncbi:MAG: polyribonucleotide nucleotidyltransferase [Planctomycetes bacterium]|nr:polyribonucleotide nucleotidyltransferase [Planctomycetota bacterium]MDP6423486.1 polyribonucleotide nucleotidyltransferase [Planctomycetota bacterium]